MSAAEKLDAIEARANAAPAGPWYMLDGYLCRRAIDTCGEDFDQVVATLTFGGGDFIAHARQDVPALVAALRAVLKPELVEEPGWLGEKRTRDVEGADPGNEAYMAHLNRVLTAAYPGGFKWGPVVLAIILDRHVRATEDARAINEHLGGDA